MKKKTGGLADMAAHYIAQGKLSVKGIKKRKIAKKQGGY
jgi:hypothetical protein